MGRAHVAYFRPEAFGVDSRMAERTAPGSSVTYREGAMISGQSLAMGAAAAGPNGTAPRCEHLDGLAQVGPQAEDCQDCRSRKDRGDPRASLVVCLTCGWVACSDDS